MTDTYLVGIDLGTSGAHITAYDTDGDIVLSNDADVESQTIEEWERALHDAALYLPSGRIICSADGTSGTALLVDEYGEPVFDPQMYHEAALAQADTIADFDAVEELEARGSTISATSPLPKILRLRERHPDRFADVEWILSPTTWLLYRLRVPDNELWTDVETDWTNALKFGADITLDEPEWYEPLFDAVDLSLDLLPAIRAPGTRIGTAEGALADDLGLGDAELYQGMTDGNASTMAAGCLEPGDYGITCGSTSVVKYVSEEIRPHEALYFHRHPIEGYLPGAAFETGVILRWISETLLDVDERRGLELARAVESGDEYDVYLQGNRSPFFDPEMGNSMLGLWPDQELSREEAVGRLVRGLATGVALSEYVYLPLIRDHFPTGIERIHLVGGGTPNSDDPFSWWNELRASIWDRPVIQMEPRTTVGSVIPAALTAGVYNDVEDASESLLRSKGVIEPDEQLTAAYEDRRDVQFDRWAEVHDVYQTWNE